MCARACVCGFVHTRGGSWVWVRRGGGGAGSWLCLPVEWGHLITARTMALHSEGSLK